MSEPLPGTQVHTTNSEFLLGAPVSINLFSSCIIFLLPGCNIWRSVSNPILGVSVNINHESVNIN